MRHQSIYFIAVFITNVLNKFHFAYFTRPEIQVMLDYFYKRSPTIEAFTTVVLLWANTGDLRNSPVRAAGHKLAFDLYADTSTF